MSNSDIRFTCFPRTKRPPDFAFSIVEIFKRHEARISTTMLDFNQQLNSNDVLAVIKDDLCAVGFQVELGKSVEQKIHRPVFYGENGEPTLRYEIDAYHTEWKCGLEAEASRSVLGNAIFRDLFQAMVIVDMDYLCLAVPNMYKYKAKNKTLHSKDYDKTVAVSDALYGHGRVLMPYGLIVIGY